MATFYIQLENRLLQISGDLTAENVSKALGYVPVSSNVTNELSQRVDNITFDSLKDNPFLQDGSGELNIVDEAGNIIAKIDTEGIHSVDFITGEHRLSNKTDKTYVDEAIKNVEVDLTGYATEEYVNNIDFYNIKDNPIVNNGDGKLLFVDENGYIGLQLEENGLYVKDVIADGHTLSQKADKSDIPSLDGYATESYVTTNLQNYATKDEVSDLVDMSVVTELQGKVNTLIGEDSDKSVRTIANEELAALLLAGNDNLQSLQELAAWIDEHPEDASAMNEAIQTNASNITKLDSTYKEADAKVLTDANEYTDNINFYTIKDNPIVNGEAGSLTFVDETGYIGLKVTEDGIYVKDVVAGEHILSNKQDSLISGSNIKTINGESILGEGNIVVEGGEQDLSEYAKKGTTLNDYGITDCYINYVESMVCIKGHSLKVEQTYPTSFDNSIIIAEITSDINKEDSSKYIKVPYATTSQLGVVKVGSGLDIGDNGELSLSNPITKTSQLTNDSGFISDDILSDGTYAVRLDGSLCSIDEADNSCIALAVISGEQKFWIEKSGPIGSIAQTYGTTFIWGSSEYDISGIPNISDNTEDFNGKSNTEASINQTTTLTEDTTIFEYCKKFNNSDENLGYSDWYIPSKDQLALILNSSYGYYSFSAAMMNINGGWGNTNYFEDKYWSSSEKSTTQAWMYCRDDFSGLGIVNKSTKGYCILIRDFEVKTIKERISILEEKVNNLSSTTGYVDSVLGDINSILESIINGRKNMITFYLKTSMALSDSPLELSAEEGMTWEEWINSEYNSIGIHASINDYICYSDSSNINYEDGAHVTKMDLIKSNYQYKVGLSTTPN